MNRTRKRYLALFILTVMVGTNWPFVSCAASPSNSRPFLPCPADWLADAEFMVSRGLLPGALVMVETPEWGLRVGTAGYADISSSLPPEPSMRYRVGGVTKLMLSTVILQLEHEGKLVLDHTIDRLIGEGLVPNGYKITLRDCLRMRSGLFDYAQAAQFKPSGKTPDSRFLPEEILYKVRDSMMKKAGAPGSEYSYSETGYLLAGLVVEHIEQKPLEQVFTERIFRLLDMRDSFLAINPDIPAPVAHGYENMSGIPADCTVYEPSTLGAANAVVSTPFDTFRFFRELFQGRTLLTQRSRSMMASLANASLEEDSYGLGLLERVSNRGTWRGCISSIRGYSLMAGYYMQGDALVMVLANTGENIAAVEELFNFILRRVSGCPTDMFPANNAIATAENGRVRLSWQAGFLYGDTYRVYVGPSRDAVHAATPDKLDGVAMIESQGNVFHAAIQAPKSGNSGNTCYWRVEAVRKRPEIEMENARKWLDHVRKTHKQLPWVPVPETETITGPVFSFRVK